jgi:hypothetical protein
VKFECKGKDDYVSRDEARKAIHRMMYDSFGGIGSNLRPYKCKHCGKWHLTSAR